MLQRIYGTAWADEKELQEHLKRLEEAQARDHRKLGKELDLFTSRTFAPAMPIFLPKGAVIYNELIDFVREFYRRDGYSEVITPLDLGHRALQDHPATTTTTKRTCSSRTVDEREYGVKPMNCPGHTLIFAMERRSYRDLPIRLADFARLHRYERRGVTHGLTRVRSFAQDDAHLFVTPDRSRRRSTRELDLIKRDLRHFGFATSGSTCRPAPKSGSATMRCGTPRRALSRMR